MRAPTEILGIRYFLLGVIFTRTDTRVESSHQGPPQNKNKSFSFHFQTARAFGPGLLILLYVLPAPLGRTTTYYHILLRGFRLLLPPRPGLITYRIWVRYPLYPIYNADEHHSPAPLLKIGNRVYVKAKYFCTTQLSKKLSEKNL